MAEVIGTGAGTITQGQRLSSNVAAARRVPQYLKETVNISGDVAPLTMLIKELGNTKTVQQAEYFHLETDYLPFSVTDDGSGAASGDTAFEVAAGHGSRVKVGSILKVLRTAEMLRVTAISTDTLTVTRAFGGTTAAAINASEVVSILSFADTEGNTSPSGISSEPTIKTNYCQTFRQSFELSGREIASEVYGEKEMVRVQKDALSSHMQQKEKAYLFQNGTNSSSPTMTGGIPNWVLTNVTNVAGALTEATLNTIIRNWYRRNFSQKKMVIMAGELFCMALDGFGRDQIRYKPDDEYIGIMAGGYRTSFGEVRIVRHGMFTQLGSDETAANKGWQGFAYGLNLDLIGECTFRGRGLELRPDIQTPDRDGRKWEYLEDSGLYVANEKAHCIVTGVTG